VSCDFQVFEVVTILILDWGSISRNHEAIAVDSSMTMTDSALFLVNLHTNHLPIRSTRLQ